MRNIILLILILILATICQTNAIDSSKLINQNIINAMITTPTPDLNLSKKYFIKLGYELVKEEESIYFTNGKVLIEINPDRKSRAGIKLFKDSWTSEIEELKKYTKVNPNENGYVLSDPSGTWIYLINGASPVEFVAQEQSFGVTGNYMGLSLETTDMEKSYNIYSVLGFSIVMGEANGGFAVMINNSGFGLSLMAPGNCPHMFFNPSMTFFNGKEGNPKVISQIRDLGIQITEEITVFNKEGIVDNIIIREPGGYGMFIFND